MYIPDSARDKMWAFNPLAGVIHHGCMVTNPRKKVKHGIMIKGGRSAAHEDTSRARC